jgi:hypothetical protein
MRILFLIITYLVLIPIGHTADFSIYKSTCADIGFTPDTDAFADCVLELYKRDKVKLVEKEKKQQNNIEMNSEKKRQSELEDIKAKQRKAQYERELKFEEAQRKRKALEKEREAERLRQAHYERERLRIERERLKIERRRAQDHAEAVDQQNRQRYLQMIPGFLDMMNPPPVDKGLQMRCRDIGNGIIKCKEY